MKGKMTLTAPPCAARSESLLASCASKQVKPCIGRLGAATWTGIFIAARKGAIISQKEK
jgi:hypothetical protein